MSSINSNNKFDNNMTSGVELYKNYDKHAEVKRTMVPIY